MTNGSVVALTEGEVPSDTVALKVYQVPGSVEGDLWLASDKMIGLLPAGRIRATMSW